MTFKQLEAYVEKGFKLFPLAEGEKFPITKNGFKNATDDLDQIKYWLENNPNCNWGASCGRDSGFVVIDIDISKGKVGDKSLKALTEKYGPLPKCPVVRTRSGGFHLYFKYDTDHSPRRAKLAKHVDFQADGSYVVIPDSIVEGQPYAWTNGRSIFELELPELPEWVYHVLGKGGEGVEFKLTEEGLVPHGNRHDYLVSIGGSLRRRGCGFETIKAALLSEYEHKCEKGKEDSDPAAHISLIAESLCVYDPEDPVFLGEDDIEFRKNSIDSEDKVLSLIIHGAEFLKDLNVRSHIFTTLEDSMFLDPENKVIFEKAKKLFLKQVSPDYGNIKLELEKEDFDLNKLDLLAQDIPIKEKNDLKYHVDNITNSYKNREAAKIFKEGYELSKRGIQNAKDIISTVSGKTIHLINDSRESTTFDTNQLALLAKQVSDDAKNGINSMNEPTGFMSIDGEIIGWAKSAVAIIAGRPGHMKTAFMAACNRNMNYRWTKQGIDGVSVVFSAEMSARELAVRDVCAIGAFDNQEFRKGRIHDDALNAALEEYRENVDTIVDQTPSPTTDYMISRTLAINAVRPVKAVFFDFIGLVGNTHRIEQLRLKEAIEGLKVLAKILDIPVIVLSQLNREIETDGAVPPAPRESHITWSDYITQLANQITFVVYPYKFFMNGIQWYRDEKDKAPPKNLLYFYVLKNRDGQPARIPLMVDPEYGRIRDPKEYGMESNRLL